MIIAVWNVAGDFRLTGHAFVGARSELADAHGGAERHQAGAESGAEANERHRSIDGFARRSGGRSLSHGRSGEKANTTKEAKRIERACSRKTLLPEDETDCKPEDALGSTFVKPSRNRCLVLVRRCSDEQRGQERENVSLKKADEKFEQTQTTSSRRRWRWKRSHKAVSRRGDAMMSPRIDKSTKWPATMSPEDEWPTRRA